MSFNYIYHSSYSENELKLDNLRVQENQEAILLQSKYFCQGFIFTILLSPSAACAEDEVAKQAAKTIIGKDGLRRLTNAVGCGAITLSCQKAAKSSPETALKVASKTGITDPKVIAAFGCGAALAWCVKYAVFDK